MQNVSNVINLPNPKRQDNRVQNISSVINLSNPSPSPAAKDYLKKKKKNLRNWFHVISKANTKEKTNFTNNVITIFAIFFSKFRTYHSEWEKGVFKNTICEWGSGLWTEVWPTSEVKKKKN